MRLRHRLRGPLDSRVWAESCGAGRRMITTLITALKLTTGEKVWYTPLAKPGTRVNNAAAVSVIPGVAFVAGSDGVLHALSTADGKILWEYNTAREFETVNKVPAKGGAINSIGPTIVNGMLFIGSGYAVSGNNFGNVLLAFSLE